MRGVMFIAGLLVLATISSAAHLDSEAMPTPYVSVGQGGMYYFKMVPSSEHEGEGTVYKVTGGEADEKVWSVQGWFAFTTFLSDDGRYLVRMGNWSRGQEPSDDDLAVAFYDNGKLLAQYSTRKLIKIDYFIRRTVSHYDWRHERAPMGFVRTPTDGVWPLHYFQLVTADLQQYTFDRRTGEIVTIGHYGG